MKVRVPAAQAAISAAGAAKLGSCPTDATREGRRRRVVLKFAAMPMLERQR